MSDYKVLLSSDAKPGFFYGYVVVLAALCIMIAVWSTYYAFGVFFKPMLVEFGWTTAMVSGAFSISMAFHPTQMGQVPDGETGGEQRLGIAPWGLSLKEAVYTGQFYILLAMLFSFGFTMFALMVHIVPHTTELGFSALTAANIPATIGGLMIAGRLLLGGAADRFGNRPIFIIGFILMSVAMLSLVKAKEIWMLYLFAAVFGFATGGMGTSESPIVAELFGLHSHGLILAIAGCGFTMGAAVGPFVVGYLFDIAGNYRGAFLVCTVISFLGLILTLLLTPVKAEPSKRISI